MIFKGHLNKIKFEGTNLSKIILKGKLKLNLIVKEHVYEIKFKGTLRENSTGFYSKVRFSSKSILKGQTLQKSFFKENFQYIDWI